MLWDKVIEIYTSISSNTMTSHSWSFMYSDIVRCVCCILNIPSIQIRPTLYPQAERCCKILGQVLNGDIFQTKSRPVFIALEESETRKTLTHKKHMVWFIWALYQLPHFFEGGATLNPRMLRVLDHHEHRGQTELDSQKLPWNTVMLKSFQVVVVCQVVLIHQP